MTLSKLITKLIFSTALITILILTSFTANATKVLFETNIGSFEVNLYDDTTPETVANFLSYVESEAYINSIIHRSVADFIIQGGGFIYNASLPLDNITTTGSVINEPSHSNVRGTIAMAKLSGDPNSATSQWFFNLVDNSEGLDPQNGGFTVFGEVVGDGMAVIDAIAALQTYNSIPLQNYDTNNDPNGDNFIRIINITPYDSLPPTTPDANIYINNPFEFQFSHINNAELSTSQSSSTVGINGLVGAGIDVFDISIQGGEYSIGCNAIFTASPSTINKGDTLCVRHTSSATYASTTETTITINEYSTKFASITKSESSSSGGGSFCVFLISFFFLLNLRKN